MEDQNQEVQGTEQEAITGYSEADLVSFGNYLLSDERKERTSELNQQAVTHADLANWKDAQVSE